jgi:DNA-binding transcriptional MerR regulator
MPIGKLKKFAELMEQDDQTILERRAILSEHQKRMLQKKAELDEALGAIERKFKMYDERLSKRCKGEGQ